jgi:hypothetical protein
MIKSFEEITKPLNEEEQSIANIIVNNFKTRKPGKNNAVTSSFMIEKFNTIGIKLNDARLRKILQYIRVNNMIIGLCATSEGYFVAANAQEFHECLESLRDRIMIQVSTFEAMKKQYNILYKTKN